MNSLRSFLVCVLLCTVSACDLAPHAIEHVQESAPTRNNSMLIISNGWHTGFVLQADRLNKALPFLKDRFATAPTDYYEFGWGDKGFYQSREITTGLTLRAMFWSSGSVVHVAAFQEEYPFPRDLGSSLTVLPLSESEFNDLIRFIDNSFARDKEGKVIPLSTGRYGDSQFYEGNGSYSVVNTCNKWTARGLKSAGMDISTPFKLTAGSINDYLDYKVMQKQ